MVPRIDPLVALAEYLEARFRASAVPRQVFLPIWRQLVLPVHNLLFLASIPYCRQSREQRSLMASTS